MMPTASPSLTILAGGQVAAVALCAAATLALASEDRADLDLFDADLLDGLCRRFVDQMILLDDGLAGDRILEPSRK